MMSKEEFRARCQQIDEQYSANRHGAEAARDQAMSRLFKECGWSQQDIAEEMGQSQPWVTCRLRFSGFLEFITTGNNSTFPRETLAERNFRAAWTAVGKGHDKETDEDRYQKVLNWLNEHPPAIKAYRGQTRKPSLKVAIVDVLTNSNRLHTAAEIADDLVEKGIETDTSQVSEMLREIEHKPPKGMTLQTRHSGQVNKYRIDERQVHKRELAVDIGEAMHTLAELMPCLEECMEIMRKPAAGREVTLALTHLSKLRRTIESLLVPESVK